MNVRGLLPSLGAGGSLIAAALCALAVFGGVLAFRGEGPGTAQADSGEIELPAGAVRARTASSTPLENVIALADGAVPAAPRPAAQRRPRTRALTRIAAPRPAANRPPVTTTPVSTPNAPSGGTTTPSSEATPPAATTPPVITGSGTVQNIVAQTRATVQPVVDAAPAPVQAPVDAVGDTVEQVAGTVDQTVDGLTGALLP